MDSGASSSLNPLETADDQSCSAMHKRDWWQMSSRSKALPNWLHTLGEETIDTKEDAALATGSKVYQCFIHHTKLLHRLLTAACMFGSLLVSPLLAVTAVGVRVPIMLTYVYGVVSLSLYRNGGCWFSEPNPSPEVLDKEDLWTVTASIVVSGAHLRFVADSRLVSSMQNELLECEEWRRQPDGSLLVAGLSMQSGISGGTQLHVRFAVNHDIRRRPGVEYGVNSLGERFNFEKASTRAMAGSNYHCDDKRAQTLYSGSELVSYSDEVASTKCSNSYSLFMQFLHETKITLEVFKQALLSGEEPGPQVQSCAGDNDPHPSSSSVLTQHDSREEVDTFKIRTFLDNVKQMVAADQPIDRPQKSVVFFRTCGALEIPAVVFLNNFIGQPCLDVLLQQPISYVSVVAEVFQHGRRNREPGVGAVSQSKRRRGILRSLFSSEKGRRK
ncbi:hypothetical protein KIN20_018458 [Parelaphostrongylus tenuis]|uniref:Uncharacterized protein n=1 Tax=Parelaphostrongylus tenuis TaxID=148309 RepID=A0AAD5MJZ9_PARTN|nr:hypothetical protein KIN20_018458 [Parelaphostrongylus tenuis]